MRMIVSKTASLRGAHEAREPAIHNDEDVRTERFE
jgi:hypothetical protein